MALMKTQSRKSSDSWPKPDTISWILLTSIAVPNMACSGSVNSPFSAKEARSWMPRHPTIRYVFDLFGAGNWFAGPTAAGPVGELRSSSASSDVAGCFLGKNARSHFIA